jgi:hypothetical protein
MHVSRNIYGAVKGTRLRCDIRFEANETGFIRLFRIEANRRILHAKRIQKEANIPFEANMFKKNRILIEAYTL